MHLHLIRHGQTDWNAIRRIQGQTESHLNDNGHAQARTLGEQLAEVPFRHAYISTSARTRETAQDLLGDRPIERTFRSDLREMRLGRWESLSWPDVEADEPAEVARYAGFDDAFEVQGAERLSQMQQRGVDALADIVRLERAAGASDEDHVAVVSHGFLLRAVLADCLNRPLTDFAGSAGLPNCAHSVVLSLADGGYRVQSIASEPPATGLWRDFLG